MDIGKKENDIYAGSALLQTEPLQQTDISALRNDLMAAQAAASILEGQKDELSRADRNTIAVSADDLVGMKYVDMAALPKDNHKNVGFMFTDATDGVFPAMINSNSAQVDAVSNATTTSHALIEAVEDALAQAMP